MILTAKRLSKTFGTSKKIQVLNQISFSVDAGESIAITGRSGEGKTTLLHILGALEEPDSGEICIGGEILTPRNSAKIRLKKVGFVFQAFYLLDDFTALENVLMPQRIARQVPDKNHGLHLLEQVGLADKASTAAKLLSGGEKQRLALARALCNDPDLILADEPSGNLDSENSEIIASLLFSLVSKRAKGLVLVTHDETLASLCSKRYVLHRGCLGT